MSASQREMKALLADLAEEAGKEITRPADPRTVMGAFCTAMSRRSKRAIQLVFRAFPPDIPVSGMRLDFGDRSMIVVEERAVPASQLVILGHELFHEEQGECGHHLGGGIAAAAARGLADEETPDAVRRAAEQILQVQEVPREALMALAARAESFDEHEADAETFGLLFGRHVRTWVTGPYAQGPVSGATVEERIDLSMTGNGGRLL
ncbi:toxin [Streptomyces sp. NPDC090493]|uniref:toxin n=1 Tax=Streptomyces sp. NPDC090493 TaxID=3365964 RepID=UPI00380C1AF0